MIIPLPLHTCYSFHFGTIPPARLTAEASRLGYTALAVTDREGVFGMPAFYEAAHKAGIRPIAGVELGYTDGKPLLVHDNCIILAKDRRGFSAISRILTERALCLPGGGADSTSTLPGLARTLAEAGDTVIALSTDARLLDAWRGQAGRYALLPAAAKGSWKKLLAGAAANGLKVVAGAGVSFLSPADREVQRLLVAIGKTATIYEVDDTELAPALACLGSPAALAETFRDLPETIVNNEAVAEACSLDSLFELWHFPAWPTDHPGGAAGLLRDLTLAGTAKRLGSIPDAYRARIDYELGIISEKGFADYFLVVRDIVGRASRTCGRGSAAASIVSWALEITDVDPLRHDLYFERFLNPGRSDPPDIDVDFAWDERDALLADVVQRYGEAHTARVANHVTFRHRGALRETARAFGLPDSEIGGHERGLSHDPAGAARDAEPTWKAITELSARIEGFPRNIGTHSGGVVIVPGALHDIVPLLKTGSGIRVTAWDKEGVEAAGLIKIDLLGNRSLAVVRDASATVAEGPDPCSRPEDDPETIELMARGDTMGVFYVESPAMRLLQKKTGAGDFAHLVIHSSIIRPAANRYINEYIDRHLGKPWTHIHPLLSGILDEAYGLMCYQEDVSKVAVALAGFTPAEADGMRKVLSKKDAVTRLDSWLPKFQDGARARGVDDAKIAEIWDMIQSFAGYSFVKAHSASYARLSFRSAWLRAHHPAEFMAAVMSNRGGYYGILAYASEARRMGLALLPPSVQDSGRRSVGSVGTIRFGLESIGGLSEACMDRIVAERALSGTFASALDFARRVWPARDDAEALAESGALDSLSPGLRRPDKLLCILSFAATREASGRGDARGAGSLFQDQPYGAASRTAFTEEALELPGSPPDSCEPEWKCAGVSRRSFLEGQMRRIGTTLTVHPLELWPGALASHRVLARDLESQEGRVVRLVGWPVTAKELLAQGELPMEFVSFEDETAIYEAVLFPDTYRRFGALLFEERPFIITGKVCVDRGGLSLELRNLERVPGRALVPPGQAKAFYGRYW
ncbi:MAG: DNA polymerase III subunit alpha [Rectinemataceae bacterium]